MAKQSKPTAKNSPAEVLLVEDVRKSYGARPALRSLSFSLKAGRVLGFLGPNGAGKTTAIRILTTRLRVFLCRWNQLRAPGEDTSKNRRFTGKLRVFETDDRV
jgi:ABC-type multidrug transport system ATPase subunit